MNIRVGHGFDAHRFAEGRKLILGGVEIPCAVGLLGHSDADVVIHAVCDALLGAAALGDIGQHFPDTDATWKDVDSRILLRHVTKLLTENNYLIQNVDVTVVAQMPKLAPYYSQIIKNLSEDMTIKMDQVNIKATTTENMGFTGRKEGIAVFAVSLILKS